MLAYRTNEFDILDSIFYIPCSLLGILSCFEKTLMLMTSEVWIFVILNEVSLPMLTCQNINMLIIVIVMLSLLALFI